MQHFAEADQYTPTEGSHFVEHLRGAAMSLGTYSVPTDGVDDQVPHREDEIYIVRDGRSQFTSGGQTVAVEPGSVLFVPAGEDHRFHNVTEDLAVLVVFSPPYSGRP